ncbi:MAG: tetratricopeptide repeat protein [Saprospirales bacterium]|nr:tetratricopeptide repeat protein [Saprospirales bacterium]
MQQQDFDLLDDYFNGLLPPESEQALRERAAADPDFAREFALRERMQRWLHREPVRQAVAKNLAEIGPDYFTANAARPWRVSWKRWALLAASFAVFAFAVWFFALRQPSLYHRYAQHAPLQFTERGAGDSPETRAERAFREGRYEEALAALRTVLTDKPGHLTARLYEGICLLELGRPAEARAAFAPIAEGTSALQADALWYLAISYLRENDPTRCRETLLRLQAGQEHYQQAQELLRALGR